SRMRRQMESGATLFELADRTLAWPIAQASGLGTLEWLVQDLATWLSVDTSRIHVIGSARFGFALVDGAKFDSRYSDLNLAVIDAGLYGRCTGVQTSDHGP